MTINDYIEKHKQVITTESGFKYRKPTPLVQCQDGLKLSIQVGEVLYCSPRRNEAGIYGTAEVGYPTMTIPEFIPYACSTSTRSYWIPDSIAQFFGKTFYSLWRHFYKKAGYESNWFIIKIFYIFSFFGNHPVNTIYAYVPVDIIDNVLKQHGGIIDEGTD